MNELLMRTVDAVAAGAGCALVAAALALELVVRRPVNLPLLAAPAAAMMLGVWAGGWMGAPLGGTAALLLGAAVSVACGAAWVGISRIVDRPMRTPPLLSAMLAAAGGLLVVLSILAMLQINQPQPPGDLLVTTAADPEMPTAHARLVDPLDTATFVIAGSVLAIVLLMMTRTRTGLAMRAVGYRPQTAALLGIDTERLIVIATAMAGAMAAIGGLLYGIRQGSADMTTLLRPGVVAAAAVMITGASRPLAAVAMAMALGSAQAFVQLHWPAGDAAGEALLVAVAVAALLVKRAERQSDHGVATA